MTFMNRVYAFMPSSTRVANKGYEKMHAITTVGRLPCVPKIYFDWIKLKPVVYPDGGPSHPVIDQIHA